MYFIKHILEIVIVLVSCTFKRLYNNKNVALVILIIFIMHSSTLANLKK